MDSRHHAIQSGALAVAILLVAPPPTNPILLVAVVVFIGVGIDADHFLIARLNTGSWKNVRRVIQDPRIAVFDQDAIFDRLDVWGEDRLLSHVLLGGLGVGALWAVGLGYWAGVTAVTLYVHLLADVFDGVRRKQQRAVEIVEELERD